MKNDQGWTVRKVLKQMLPPVVVDCLQMIRRGITDRKSGESRPLEDMYPFLPREEIHQNMHLFGGDAA